MTSKNYFSKYSEVKRALIGESLGVAVKRTFVAETLEAVAVKRTLIGESLGVAVKRTFVAETLEAVAVKRTSVGELLGEGDTSDKLFEGLGGRNAPAKLYRGSGGGDTSDRSFEGLGGVIL